MQQRIVFDTNIYLSALIFGGNSRRVLEQSLQLGIGIIVSEEIFTEMRRVISRKFPEVEQEYTAFEMFLRTQTVMVPLGSIQVDICRDSKDNHIFETAILGSCSYIVTGDKDILTLEEYQKIRTVTPAQFLAMFN